MVCKLVMTIINGDMREFEPDDCNFFHFKSMVYEIYNEFYLSNFTGEQRITHSMEFHKSLPDEYVIIITFQAPVVEFDILPIKDGITTMDKLKQLKASFSGLYPINSVTMEVEMK